MTDPGVDAPQAFDQRAVLAGGHVGRAPGFRESLGAHGDAGARFLLVPRPGIGWVRVQQSQNFIEHAQQKNLAEVVESQTGADACLVLRVDIGRATHHIRPAREFAKVFFQPIRRRHGVGIRGEEDALWPGESGGMVQRQAAGLAGGGKSAAERALHDMQARQMPTGGLTDLQRAVRAVVQQQQDMVERDALARERM